jgi:hypothetical protein
MSRTVAGEARRRAAPSPRISGARPAADDGCLSPEAQRAPSMSVVTARTNSKTSVRRIANGRQMKTHAIRGRLNSHAIHDAAVAMPERSAGLTKGLRTPR